MSDVKAIIERAHELILELEYEKAQVLLKEAVDHHPDDADLNAELGIIYCYGQKEFEAVELLPKSLGSERHGLLAQILRDYFYCRKELAVKFGVPDEKADLPRKKVAKYIKGKPEGIGIKLSACLIVKNEEKRLERCLASVKPIADEIVVVDTGSTDKTVEIAQHFGATIGHFEWCDDFAAARNESLRLATGNWALWIDADEELDPAGFDQIREGLMRPQFAGYYFQIINFMEEKAEANTYVHTAVRLFRIVPGIVFTGRIHEQIIGGFKERGYVPATLTKAVLKHYGYQESTMIEKDKIHRTISMLEKEVAEFPQEPFHLFNLANAYSVAMLPDQAEKIGRKCIEYIDRDAPYGPAAFQILTSALVTLKRPGEALLVCGRAIDKGYDTILNEFERAHALFEMGRYDDALAAIDKCMGMEWPLTLTGDYGIKTYKSHVLKSQILCALGRCEEAEEMADFALNHHKDFPMALFSKAKICEKAERFDEAYELFLKCSASPGLEICGKFAAKAAVAQQKFADALPLFQTAWQASPEDFDAWLGWANVYQSLGDHAGFIHACQLVGEDRMPTADLIVNWGRALEAIGDVEGALGKFGAAIQRSPNNANAYFNCGDLLYKLGHYHEAAHIYELGLKREPVNPQAWFVLGNCFAKMNVLEGARTSYTQALIIAPEYAEARHNLETVSEAA